MNIGIIGNGFIGKAFQQLYNKHINIFVYDINPELCVPKDLKIEELCICDLVFISVPTPQNPDGSVHLDIIDKVINNLRNINYKNEIIIRSTVPPGTSDQYNVYFMPEFLTEKNYLDDFRNNKTWIFGLLDQDCTSYKEKIVHLINICHKQKCIQFNNIKFVPNIEAEMIKYFRNTFLSIKVSYCNEIHEYCKKKGIDYNSMVNLAAADERIGLSHTSVPGHDGKYGFGGTCFPKDCNGLLNDMKKNNIKSYILENAINRNEQVDRSEHDWQLDIGRAFIPMHTE